MAARIIIVAAPWLLLTWSAAAQPAPDCRRAATPVDKAICADPKLAAADKGMAAAYAALRTRLPAEQHTALLADQREWLRHRNETCAGKSGEELPKCLLAETEPRRRFLAGEYDNGTADAPRLLPNFISEERKSRYKISIEYPQIAAASVPAAAAFNKVMRGAALPRGLADFRTFEPGPGGANWYESGYTVEYLDRRLASIVFGVFSYGGGAHPNTSVTSVLFDLKQGRALDLPDILADPQPAIAAIASECKARLQAEATKDGWDFFDDADKHFAEVVGNVATWSADKDGIDIQFDPYSVAAYAAGRHDCQLTYAELARWLKPGGPLPPQQEGKQ